MYFLLLLLRNAFHFLVDRQDNLKPVFPKRKWYAVWSKVESKKISGYWN